MVFAKLSITAWPEPCGQLHRISTLSLPRANRQDRRTAVYFAGAVSLTGIPSTLAFSPCLLASFRSLSMTSACCSFLIPVSCAFAEQTKAQETRIKKEQHADVIDRLLNEANKQGEKANVEGIPVKETAPAK